jgi:hypothetical protein
MEDLEEKLEKEAFNKRMRVFLIVAFAILFVLTVISFFV